MKTRGEHMDGSKKTYLVQKPGTPELVPIAVAPGESVGEVLAAVGAPGALGLSTAPAQPGFALLPGAVLFSQAEAGMRLYIVDSCCP
jgi:hypothetical protein